LKTVTFTEFRKQASGLLAAVENGETLIVLRHGKPIAEVSPISSGKGKIPSWKKPGLRLVIPGVHLSTAILQERRNEEVL